MESLHQIQIFFNQGANKSEDYGPQEVQDSILAQNSLGIILLIKQLN